MNGTSITAGTKPANQKNRSSWLLAGLSLGYFIVLLDTTVVTVALPAIRDTLGGGLSGMSWVTGAYTMVFASMLLGMGSLADRLGAARVFLGGIVLFMLASVLCAVSPAIGWLIGFRALLGVGGAALLPSSLTIIAETLRTPPAGPRRSASGRRCRAWRLPPVRSSAAFWSTPWGGRAFFS